MAKYPQSIVVLTTHENEALVIRGNPTIKAVQGFAAEHNRRAENNEASGRNGERAIPVFKALRYSSELAYREGEDPVAEITVKTSTPAR